MFFNNVDFEKNSRWGRFSAHSSMGNDNEALPLLYVLDLLVNHAGMENIQIHTLCKGTLVLAKMMEMCYTKGSNYQETFGLLKIDKVAQTKIQNSIKTLVIAAPIIDFATSIEQFANIPSRASEGSLDNIPSIGSLANNYVVKPLILNPLSSGLTYLGVKLFETITLYNHKQPNAIDLFNRIPHVRDEHEIKCFITGQDEDLVVGNKTRQIAQFATSIPSKEVYVTTSGKKGHLSTSWRQDSALNAFNEQSGFCHYALKDSLEQGKKTLNNSLISGMSIDDIKKHIKAGYQIEEK